jgi:ribonucleotide monophosphatase NagD (HAD superfamily)
MAMGSRFVAGNGCILSFLETATGIKPTIMGKPSTRAFDLIRQEHDLADVPLSKFLMVGDNL